MNAGKLSHWWVACYNLSFLSLACLNAFCVVKLSHFCLWKRGLGRRPLLHRSALWPCTNPATDPFPPHLSLRFSHPGTWIGRGTIWHPRKNKASLSWRKSLWRKRKGTENKLKARQTQKADFPFSTFSEEEGREVPYGQKPALPLDFQLKSEAQGKDSSSAPVRRDCKHNTVSCRTVRGSHWRLPH